MEDWKIQSLQATLQEYEQLKQEIRNAFNVYTQIYTLVITLIVALPALGDSQNDLREMLFALIPFVVLGNLAVTWYGHEVTLARLSARLKIIKHRLNMLLQHPDLFNWEKYWANFSPDGKFKQWQRVLDIISINNMQKSLTAQVCSAKGETSVGNCVTHNKWP